MRPTFLKQEVIRARLQGFSVRELAVRFDVAPSTVSLWVRDVALPVAAKKLLEKKQVQGRSKGNTVRKEQVKEAQNRVDDSAERYLQSIKIDASLNKYLLALLYGCEGAKRSERRLNFVNSDPKLIMYFLALLRSAYRLDESKFRVVMHLHAYHDEEAQRNFWSRVTGIPRTQFSKPYRKTNGGKNKREGYQGCISLRYNDSAVQKEIYAIYLKMLLSHTG